MAAIVIFTALFDPSSPRRSDCRRRLRCLPGRAAVRMLGVHARLSRRSSERMLRMVPGLPGRAPVRMTGSLLHVDSLSLRLLNVDRPLSLLDVDRLRALPHVDRLRALPNVDALSRLLLHIYGLRLRRRVDGAAREGSARDRRRGEAPKRE